MFNEADGRPRHIVLGQLLFDVGGHFGDGPRLVQVSPGAASTAGDQRLCNGQQIHAAGCLEELAFFYIALDLGQCQCGLGA